MSAGGMAPTPPPQAGELFRGDVKYYKHISWVLFGALGVCLPAILFLNVDRVEAYVKGDLGQATALVLELYFWAALGGTVASYKFFAEDKETNETESLRQAPDRTVLRLPGVYDVVLYGLRIVLSGVLGVVGAAIALSGLSFFDAAIDTSELKQRAFLRRIGVHCRRLSERLLGLPLKRQDQALSGQEWTTARVKLPCVSDPVS